MIELCNPLFDSPSTKPPAFTSEAQKAILARLPFLDFRLGLDLLRRSQQERPWNG